MSSPSRQISNRRLPPLPNSTRSSPIRRIPSGGSVKGGSASSTTRHGPVSNHQGSQVNNHGHYDLNVPFNEGPFRPALIQGKAIERPTIEPQGNFLFMQRATNIDKRLCIDNARKPLEKATNS